MQKKPSTVNGLWNTAAKELTKILKQRDRTVATFQKKIDAAKIGKIKKKFL